MAGDKSNQAMATKNDAEIPLGLKAWYKKWDIMSYPVACRGCGQNSLEPLLDFGDQPVAHRLKRYPNQVELKYRFRIHLCTACALVQVVEPISPDILYKEYNYNFSSWKTEPHINDEVLWICDQGVPDKVCDIGANDGRFLELMRENGSKVCVGVEPNPISAGIAQQRGFPIYPEFLENELAYKISSVYGLFDIIVIRQVLEHIHNLSKFLDSVTAMLAPKGLVFIDIPDLDASYKVGDGTTLWEEHVSYFNERTLRRTLLRCGLNIIEARRYDFSGGCLAVMAQLGKKVNEQIQYGTPGFEELSEARMYAERIDNYRNRIQGVLQGLRKQKRGIAIYGAGVRSAAASNFLGLGKFIDVSIDDQPERQGLVLPGSCIPIKALKDVPKNKFGTVFLLAVNNENERRVKTKISERDEPSIVASICGPADIWAELNTLEIAIPSATSRP